MLKRKKKYTEWKTNLFMSIYTQTGEVKDVNGQNVTPFIWNFLKGNLSSKVLSVSVDGNSCMGKEKLEYNS